MKTNKLLIIIVTLLLTITLSGCGKKTSNNIEQTIKENFTSILKTNNGTSSNPYDYINNEYYKNIINIGMDAIPVITKMYNENKFESKNGLEAYISTIMIQEIANCNIKEKYDLNYSTPEEFYELWNDYNCELYKENKKVVSIVDKSKEIDGFTCLTALEPFYEDEEYVYSYSCIKSDYIIVVFSDNSQKTVKEALKYNEIKITDLDKNNIKYYKNKK